MKQLHFIISVVILISSCKTRQHRNLNVPPLFIENEEQLKSFFQGKFVNEKGQIIEAKYSFENEETKQLYHYPEKPFNTYGLFVLMPPYIRWMSVFRIACLIKTSRVLEKSITDKLNIYGGEMDEIVNGAIIRQYTKELNQTKQQGLNAVEKWLRNNRQPLKGVEYGLMPISYETASMIWLGKFKTWDEVHRSYDETDILILYRKQYDKIRDRDIYIIETFFME